MAPHPAPVMQTRAGRPLTRWGVAVAVLATLSACAAPRRVVAFGDVHGDLHATREALRMAGAIDEGDRWIGGRLIVVQTGDQLDRGDDEQAILDLFERLRVEAKAAGGAFHPLLGNHEIMNVEGDFRYVTQGGWADFAEFAGAAPPEENGPESPVFEPEQLGRVAAFRPGGTYALLLSGRDLILQVDETVFVHGGVLPGHAEYGIDRINDETRSWLRGEAGFPAILEGSESPHWTRLFSREPDAEACETLSQVLSILEARRMVVGHTVQQDGITSACDGMVWRIDTGMSSYYGGRPEVLEIVEDSVRVLRPGG